MSFFLRILVFTLLVYLEPVLFAQETIINAGYISDYDPLIYNGKQYDFFVPLNTGGDQFLSGPEYVAGSVTIRGVRYNYVRLNYDIYNQQVVLQYVNSLGARNQIVLSDAWLESFSLNGKNFERIPSQDSIRKIFQVIGAGNYRILYRWRKDLVMDGFVGARNHTFSPAIKEMNLLSEKGLRTFTNNRSFCALFDISIKGKVLEYIRDKRINIRKASDVTIDELVKYLNSLSIQ
jgi:hypothetical protein